MIKERINPKAVRLLVAFAALAVAPVSIWAHGQHGHNGSKPLVIEKQGSFFVGGRTVFTNALTGDPTGGLFPPNQGSITVDQMYVEFQKPVDAGRNLPVVMIHGGTLSGKSYETTPDGRMGWDEYFLRKKYPVYLVDQVSRARSGFDATVYNEVKMGLRPPSDQPSILRISHETGWTWWRVGPTPGVPFSDTKFPVSATAEFQKQAIPDFNAILPAANPTYRNLADLANKLGGAVMIGHSQSAFFPERAAFLDNKNIKGIVSLETGLCPASFTPQEIQSLTKIPILIIFGDHLEDAPPAFAQLWVSSLANCRLLAQSINAAGGKAKVLHLPEIGIRGNSHFLMFDKNSHQIADLILAWIDKEVAGKGRRKH
jgi:pimeloyl-ACP methyl ester carboxylesterase